MVRNVLLSGYYGFGNTGDEAILASTVKALRKARPDLNIMVLSKHPDETSRSYDVESYPRMAIGKVMRAISKADLVIFGGGSLLQDATSLRSLMYYLAIIYLSRIFKKPVVVYANGIGPVNSRLGRILTRRALTQVEEITVRDGESENELRRMGVTKNIRVTADPAFLLEPSPGRVVHTILESQGIQPSPGIIWIALREIKAPSWFREQFMGLISWMRQEGFVPCFLAMQERDIEVANGLNKEFTGENSTPLPVVSGISPEDALGILGKGEFCIGMRLHTLILSARTVVPFMGIEIDPKIGAFCRIAGCPVLPQPASSPNLDIHKEFADLVKNKDRYVAILGRNLPVFTSLARDNIDVILSHLE